MSYTRFFYFSHSLTHFHINTLVPHNRRPQFTHSQYCFHIAKIHIFSVTAKSTIRANGNGADEYRRRHTAVDIPMVFVGFLLVGGEGRDAGGIGSLDDGIEGIIDCVIV